MLSALPERQTVADEQRRRGKDGFGIAGAEGLEQVQFPQEFLIARCGKVQFIFQNESGLHRVRPQRGGTDRFKGRAEIFKNDFDKALDSFLKV